MKATELYRNGEHRWLVFGQDPNKPEQAIDTNQVVICNGPDAMLLDPGGPEIFPAVVAALTKKITLGAIRHILVSHQDPDIGSALSLWRRICRPDVHVHLSWMWAGFVAHFDATGRYSAIPDEGYHVPLGSRTLQLLPAHYLHSPGNFNLYDPTAKILFSGDIGASVFPGQQPDSFFVENFEQHIPFMRGFHQRWMPSAEARDAWVAMVRALDVEMIVPQHGLVFRGDDVPRFLDWLLTVKLGSGLASFAASTQAKHWTPTQSHSGR